MMRVPTADLAKKRSIEAILAQPACEVTETASSGGLQALGSENRGHLENAAVILLLLELRAGFLIDQESNLRVQLQRRSGHRSGYRTFDGLGNRRGFGRTAGQRQNSPRLQNGSDSHGDGALRNLFAGGKKLAVVLNCFFRQDFQARSGTETGSRLVETDVAVAADAQDLQVDASRIANALFVGGAVLAIVFFQRAVRNMNVGRRDVHVRKKVLAHEVGEALRMVGGKSQVFVQIEGDHARKIERLFPVQANQLLIHAEGRATGRQAKAKIGIAADGIGDDARRFAAEFFRAG